MRKQVTVSIPATTANLGPGFDCLGLALELFNTFTFLERERGLSIKIQGEGAANIKADETNLVVRAAERLFDKVGRKPNGLNITLNNNIPVGSGLGSSASAVVGGILAANNLVGGELTQEELLALASEIEGHPDNVAPALFGGLTLVIKEGTGLIVERIPVPSMAVVVVVPEVDLPTVEARAALPGMVSQSEAVFNISRMGLLVRAFQGGEFDKFTLAMKDQLHQPYRIPLIPGMENAFAAGYEAGASAVVLSGAGPGVIALTKAGHKQIGASMTEAFDRAGISSRTWILPINKYGAQLS